MLLGQNLLEGHRDFADAWNFGPNPEDNSTVSEVLTLLKSHWPNLSWQQTWDPQPHEANLLYLDNTKSKVKLGWQPIWSLAQTLQATAEWYREQYTTGLVNSKAQLITYIHATHSLGASWVTA